MRMTFRTLMSFQYISHVFQLCSYLLFTRNGFQCIPSIKVKTIVENRFTYHLTFIIALLCICLLLSACQIPPESPVQRSKHPTPTPSVEASPTPSESIQETITPINTPAPASIPTSSINPNRPVLAFYYMWYAPSDWCSCHLSDLPTIQYTSSDEPTIARRSHGRPMLVLLALSVRGGDQVIKRIATLPNY